MESSENLQQAFDSVKSGRFSYREASELYNVSKSKLHRHVKKQIVNRKSDEINGKFENHLQGIAAVLHQRSASPGNLFFLYIIS